MHDDKYSMIGEPAFYRAIIAIDQRFRNGHLLQWIGDVPTSVKGGEPMKQPMAYSKGKAAQVRKMRHGASIIKSRAKVYSRMKKWDETGAGTNDYSIKIELNDGWSFEEDRLVYEKSFTSAALTMRGLSMTYRQTEEMILISTEKNGNTGTGLVPDNWEERIAALAEITND